MAEAKDYKIVYSWNGFEVSFRGAIIASSEIVNAKHPETEEELMERAGVNFRHAISAMESHKERNQENV